MKKDKKTIINIALTIAIILMAIIGIFGYINNKAKLTIVNVDIGELKDQLIEANKIATAKEMYIEELQQRIDNISEFNKFYSKGLSEFNGGIYERSSASYNFDLWGWYYEQGFFIESIDYCIVAREGYATANEKFQKSISYFEEAKKTAGSKYKELIGYYIKTSNAAIDMNWATYEACEYYESASSYYNQGLYDVGDEQLSEGNKKIVKRDSLVKIHNTYYSKIEVLGENI